MSAGPDDTLRAHVRELEQAAARLRSGEVRGEEAAAVVERCAELAGSISEALEREARAATAELPFDDAPEQERLL
jgi:exonuclease VII small subunit